MADANGRAISILNEKNVAARGDIGAASGQPALVAMMQRAMQRMTIESMLKQAGADVEKHTPAEPRSAGASKRMCDMMRTYCNP